VSQSARRRVWLDTDPGFDDWLAMLMLAADSNIEWIGTSVVAGNAPLPHTLANALSIRHHYGLRVPVYSGCSQPLAAAQNAIAPLTAQNILGASGMRTRGDALPLVTDAPDGLDAVDALCQALKASPTPVTIVALGPLTNIASALLRDPGVALHIAEIAFMGGSTERGNHTPAAEFNIYADPEAADIVMHSGVALRMFGLNLCRQVLLTQAHVQAMQKWPGQRAQWLAGYLDAYQRIRSADGAVPMPLYDPVVTAWLAAPECFEFTPARVDIELQGRFTRGMTVCNLKLPAGMVANVQVAMQTRGDPVVQCVMDAVQATVNASS
jgi:purine nucleosidase